MKCDTVKEKKEVVRQTTMKGKNKYRKKKDILAGPAVFLGLLRAFGKCTNGVAFSIGRPNLATVRLTL